MSKAEGRVQYQQPFSACPTSPVTKALVFPSIEEQYLQSSLFPQHI